MAKHQTVFSANNQSSLIATVKRRREAPYYLVTFVISGTFGSGTLAFYLSPDLGTTLVALKDQSDNAVSATAATSFDAQLGNSNNNNDVLQIWATITGATSPNVTVNAYDNS